MSQEYLTSSGILVEHNFNSQQLEKVEIYLSALLADFFLTRDLSLSEGEYNVKTLRSPKIESRLNSVIMKVLKNWTGNIRVVYGESQVTPRGHNQYGISFIVWGVKNYNLVISQINVSGNMLLIEESSYNDSASLSDQMEKRAYELNLIKD